MTLYLDYNATTPVNPEVLDCMVEVYKNNFGNAGSRTHIYGQRANEIVKKARNAVADLLDVDNNEVIFTSGATESNNIAILGLARWGEQNDRKHIISTKIEHKAVLEPLNYLKNQGFFIDLIGVDSSGRIKADDVLSLVRPDTLMVSIMHANNETGIIQPVDEVGEALSNSEAFFHIDAAQTYGKLVDELRNIKYDLLSVSGHKTFAPQGIGSLILKSKNYKRPPVKPIFYGGGQEKGIRPGTLPVALIAGLGKASEIADKERSNWYNSSLAIKNSILDQLSGLNYTINGDQNYSMPHVLNISFHGVDSEALMLAVRDNYAFSNGSACTSNDYQPSHVLQTMGLSNVLIDCSVRLSWGHQENISIEILIDKIRLLNLQ